MYSPIKLSITQSYVQYLNTMVHVRLKGQYTCSLHVFIVLVRLK